MYKEVGFVMTANGVSVERSTDTVYGGTHESGFTAEQLGGKYMYSFEITDFPEGATNVTVTPYVVYLDGEKELGETAEYVVTKDEKGLGFSQTATGLEPEPFDIPLVNAAQEETTAEETENKGTAEEPKAESTEAAKETAVFTADEVLSDSAFVFEPEPDAKEAA